MSSPADRIAKAWRVAVEWSDDADVVFARSAGAARYRLMLRLRDCYPDLTFSQITAWRAPACDRRLPGEHRLVAELSPTDRDVLLGAFGARYGRTPGYRDHFCTAPGDARMLRLAWELGLFSGPFGEGPYGTSPGWAGAFFYLTELGKHVAASMLPTYD